jgi:hypothetical protein
MLVEFDINTLTQNNVNAHQFLIAQLIFEKKLLLLTKYLELTNSFETLEQDLGSLVDAKFIIRTQGDYDLNKIIIRSEFVELITNGDIFEELLTEYPTVVNRPDGSPDLLKTDLVQSRLIYLRITKENKAVHQHILKCLKYEVEQRKSTNTLSYMRRLPKWLASESWKAYEERVDDDSFSVRALEENGYGHEIE